MPSRHPQLGCLTNLSEGRERSTRCHAANRPMQTCSTCRSAHLVTSHRSICGRCPRRRPQLTEGHLSRNVEPHQETEARTQIASSRIPLTASYAAGLVDLRERLRPCRQGAGRTRRSGVSQDAKTPSMRCRTGSAAHARRILNLPRSMSVSVNRGQTGRDVWCMHAPITQFPRRTW